MECFSVIRGSIPSKLISKFKMIPIWNTTSCFYEARTVILKFLWKKIDAQNSWGNTGKKGVSGIKALCGVLMTETARYSAVTEQPVNQNRESTWIDPNAQGPSGHGKGGVSYLWAKVGRFFIFGTTKQNYLSHRTHSTGPVTHPSARIPLYLLVLEEVQWHATVNH